MGKDDLTNSFEIETLVREDAIETLRQQFESIKTKVDEKGNKQTQGTRWSRVLQKSMTQGLYRIGRVSQRSHPAAYFPS